MQQLFSKLTAIFRRRKAIGEDLAAEMVSHIELRIDDNIEAGMTRAEAEAEARRHFGNTVLAREQASEAWQFPRIETVLQDFRYGLRGIRRSPAFATAVILTLALGIGANTAIFSVVYNVLLRPLPYPSGERLVLLGENAGKASGISVTWVNFTHWRAENHSFEQMAAMTNASFTMTGRGDASLTHAAMVTPAFFGLTGAHAQLGRLFGEDDDRLGVPGVAVLTWEFFMRQFGANPAALNTTLVLNGKPYQVIGVLRPDRRVITSGAEYYLPLGPSARRNTNRSGHGSIRALGLLKPGVSLTAARGNIDELMKRLAVADPGPESEHRASARYLTETITGDIRKTLVILMAAVGLLLCIACANVASLMLVRAAARTREMAIRTAIGAGRVRVARQLLTENLTIAAIGGMAGIAVAQVCLRMLLKLAPESIPRLAEISLNIPVLCFAAGTTLLTGVLAGLGPVLASGKVNVSRALKDGAAGSGTGIRGQRLRSALVVAEIAFTLILAFASGLLIRSLMAAQNSDPGFDSRNLLALGLELPPSAYRTDDQVKQFYTRAMEDMRRLPGVMDTGVISCPPGSGDCGDWWYSPLDRPAPARDQVPLTLFQSADAMYFRTMRIKLLAGRGFGTNDRDGSTPVTIVNEEIARKWWATPQAAIGQRIKFGGPYAEGNIREIVGVAANVSQMGLDGERVSMMYFPYLQEGSRAMAVMLRTTGDPAALIPAVRLRVAALDRNLPIQSLIPYESMLGATLARRRFSTLLLGIFAALAMILAGVGIYGVLNFWVSVRNREIAIRMALGAPRPSILRWAGGHALRLALAGVALGVIGSLGASRWLVSMVYGVPARSPVTLVWSALAVIAIAMAGSGLPVWRATRVAANRNLREG